MKRVSGLILVLVLLALSTSAFASFYPSVELVSFEQATYTYTYRVTCPSNSTYPFGRLTVLCEVPQGGIYYPWGHGEDTPPTTNWEFYTQDREWDNDYNPTKSNAVWQKTTLQDMVPANTAWTGQFMLIVPNSRPVWGTVVTMDGGPQSESPPHEELVAGPALIPEPSSLLALGGLVGGLLPLIRRRR